MTRTNSFVADGYWRACTGLQTKVRAEVTSEYAERIAQASFLELIRLKFEMNWVIKQRVHENASPDALY